MNGARLAAAVVLLLVGLAPAASHANDDAQVDQAKGGTRSATATTSLDMFSGAFTYHVPIEVPAHYGVEPDLAFAYSSHAKSDLLGVGWSIQGLSKITRRAKSTYYQLDGSVLEPCTRFGGNYCTRTPSFSRISKSGATWTVTSTDGTVAVYASIGLDTWGLNTVTDAQGRTVTYNWSGPRPTSIKYGRNNYATIAFGWETRLDRKSMATGSGISILAHRLATVEVKVGTQLVRRYELDYTKSGVSGRSLLASIQMYGRDGTSSLPPTKFTYGSAGISTAGGGTKHYKCAKEESWGCPYGATKYVGTCCSEEVHLVGDYDGDGALTLQNRPKSATGYRWVAADTSGDGKDQISSVALGSSNDSLLAGNYSDATPHLWGDDATSFHPYNISSSSMRITGDFNGDGVDENKVLDRMSRLRKLTTQAGSGSVTSCRAHWAGAADFNGDGYADYWQKCLDPTYYGPWPYYSLITPKTGWTEICLSHGNGTGFSCDYGPPITELHTGYYEGTVVRPADLNGDGLTDLALFSIRSCVSGAPIGPQYHSWKAVRYVSVGDGTFIKKDSAPVGSSATPTAPIDVCALAGIYAGDFNGDGKADLAVSASEGFVDTDSTGSTRYSESPKLSVVVSGAPFAADVLTSLTNGMGGTTAIAYGRVEVDPIDVVVATTVTESDGRGNNAVVKYTYASPAYDRDWGEFRGFGTVSTSIAGRCDQTWFLQDVSNLGRVRETQTRICGGALLHRTVRTWASNLEIQSDEYIYAGSSSRRRSVTRTHDGYGNVTQETSWGSCAASGSCTADGDEKTVITLYKPNTIAFIVGRPARIQVREGVGAAGALLAMTYITYDTNAGWNTPPVGCGTPPCGGLPTQRQRWVDTTNAYVTTRTEYDGFGNVHVEHDELGARTEHLYDSTYNQFEVAIRNPLYFKPDSWQTTLATWDPVCGVSTQERDLNRQWTKHEHDVFCRKTRVDRPGGGFETYAYISWGSPTAQRVRTETNPADASGNLWNEQYLDGKGRTYKTRRKGPSTGSEILVERTFTKRGQLASETLPYYAGGTKYTRTYSYDDRDRRTRVTHPDATYVRTVYGIGSSFATVEVIDETGHRVTEHFDADDKLVRRVRSLGGVQVDEIFTWDERGHLVAIEDDRGNRWSYTYDSIGRQLHVSDPDRGVRTFEYDAAGRITKTTDAKDQVTVFTYDLRGRMLTKTARAGTAQEEKVSWQYDARTSTAVGKVSAVLDPSGQEYYAYDAAGRLVNHTRVVNKVAYPITTRYDAGGRKLWTTYPDGDTEGSADRPLVYDGAGRLFSIPGKVKSVRYDAADRANEQVNSNGTITTFSYSAQRGWLTDIDTLHGTSILQQLGYTRTADGAITGVTSPVPTERWTYVYDDLHRLTAATNLGDAALSHTFAYDTIDNLTCNSRVGASCPNYSYPGSGPTSIRPHAPKSVAGQTFSYDANGNLVSGYGRAYIYDGEDRPVAIGALSFEYNGNGKRVKKVAGGVATLYVGDEVEVEPASCKVRKYLELGVERNDDQTLWLHKERQGSIHVITNKSGAVVQRYGYAPYGEQVAKAGAFDEPRSYIGERLDETGLLFLNHRYYDPVVARFTAADPSNPNEPGVGVNRYAYAGNNPIMNRDPEGLSFVSEAQNWLYRASPIASPQNQSRALGQHGPTFSPVNSCSVGVTPGAKQSEPVDLPVLAAIGNPTSPLGPQVPSMGDRISAGELHTPRTGQTAMERSVQNAFGAVANAVNPVGQFAANVINETGLATMAVGFGLFHGALHPVAIDLLPEQFQPEWMSKALRTAPQTGYIAHAEIYRSVRGGSELILSARTYGVRPGGAVDDAFGRLETFGDRASKTIVGANRLGKAINQVHNRPPPNVRRGGGGW